MDPRVNVKTFKVLPASLHESKVHTVTQLCMRKRDGTMKHRIRGIGPQYACLII